MDLPGGKHGGVLSGGDAGHGREVRRMKKESMKEKLEEYCKEAIADSRYSDNSKCNWAFGAIDFACNAGLISSREYEALLEEFQLLEQGG